MSLNYKLEAGYHMDDTSDFSGNGHTFTNNGTTLTTDKNNETDKARKFDGVSDNINLGNVPFPNNEYTISFWVYLISFSAAGNNFILGKYNPPNDYPVSLAIDTTGKLVVYSRQSGTSNFVVSNSSIPTNQWTLVTITRKNQFVDVYFDKIKDLNQANITQTTVVDNAEDVILGKQSWATYTPEMKLDEFRIYSRVLTQYEITQLYYGYDTEANQVGILNEGLEAAYHFSNNVNDFSGNGNNGTAVNLTYAADKNSVANSAGSFNGTSYVNCGSGDFLNNSTNFTISAWFKTTSNTSQLAGHWGDETGDDRGILFAINTDGTVRFNTSTDGLFNGARDLTTTSTYNDGNWHFATATYDGSEMKLYVDNIEEKSLAVTGGIFASTAPLMIGTFTADETNWYYTGEIDEVRFYTRALTAYEVYQLYLGYDLEDTCVETLNEGLDGGYHFTGDVTDFSGNGNNGTATDVSYVNDKNGVTSSAGSFNGTTSQVDLGTGFNSIGSGDYTATVWFNSNSLETGANSRLIINDDSAHASYQDKGLDIFLRDGNIEAQYREGTVGEALLTSTTTFAINTWYFVTLTRQGTTAKLYVNAIEEDSITNAEVAQPIVDNMWIGYLPTGSQRYFDGEIDEARIYSRILFQDEIIELNYGYDNPMMCPTSVEAGKISNALMFGKPF